MNSHRADHPLQRWLTAPIAGYFRKAALFGVAAFSLLFAQATQAQTESVLYSFIGSPDAANPNGGLILDAHGNLYGTTAEGGTYNGGTAFRITPAGKEILLYSFSGGTDGLDPAAGLIAGDRTLYGIAMEGGANSAGTVFDITNINQVSVLASFSFEDGGGYPDGALLRDKQGNLYGTNSGYNGGYGNGAVFKISSSNTLTILYKFSGGVDGLCPYGNLVSDAAGNLYGTTYRGGTSGRGNVYELSPDGAETVLYSFTGGADGGLPAAGLIRDFHGNLYGTTISGGQGYGTVFKLTPGGQETVLYSFNGSDGFEPSGNLVTDGRGNLYGATLMGGSHFQGNIFRLSTSGAFTQLYSFTGGADGGWPDGALVFDKKGNLYGTTIEGGNSNCVDGCGVVFRLTP